MGPLGDCGASSRSSILTLLLPAGKGAGSLGMHMQGLQAPGLLRRALGEAFQTGIRIHTSAATGSEQSGVARPVQNCMEGAQ